MRKILIVEDDNDINAMIKEALLREGLESVSAYSGTEALLRLENDEFSLVILDLMLPGMEGQEVLKRARQTKNIPFIVLSAKDELDTKVELLTLGANDYMTKPFEIKELLARVQVQLRMSRVDATNDSGIGETASEVRIKRQTLDYKELKLDLNSKSLEVNGNIVSLTAQEYKIMEMFLKNTGKVFSKNEIYEYAWDDYYMGEDKTIYVHISNIRQKIKKYAEEEYIETVWGLGFKL